MHGTGESQCSSKRGVRLNKDGAGLDLEGADGSQIRGFELSG